MEIKEYDNVVSSECIILNAAIGEVEDKVRGRINNGWTPIGSIFVYYNPVVNRNVAVQTMVR